MTRDKLDRPSHEKLVERVKDALNAQEHDIERLARIRTRIASGPVGGGTTLRHGHSGSRWWIGGSVLAAAAALLLLIAMPALDRRTTVSAAEILGRSRTALSAPVTGVELLTYDLSVAGVLADLVPPEQAGLFTVEETIDHDHPGRYRLLKLAADGTVMGGVADDPVRATRVRYLRANGRGYLLRFTAADAASFSLPALKRMALQTFIALMQAQGPQDVRDVPCESETCYEVTIPESVAGADALVSLTRGRALITTTDARLVEFSAVGEIMRRPFGIEFSLRQREIRSGSGMTDADFDIAPRPGDVVLEGSASSNPMWDVFERASRQSRRNPGDDRRHSHRVADEVLRRRGRHRDARPARAAG